MIELAKRNEFTSFIDLESSAATLKESVSLEKDFPWFDKSQT